ncbi:hypothetical protein Leryth_022723 [Lithospermum erythrorhizon]|nr:hypothetical protein Leryth_022723 [Lithospermum erythrorhizon]
MSYKGGKVEYFDYCDGDTFELGSVESWAFRVGLRKDPEEEGFNGLRPLMSPKNFVNTNGLDDLEDSNGNFRISTESVEMLKALNIERTNKLSIIEFHLDDDTCGGVVDEVVGGVVDKIVGGAADNDHDAFDDGDLGGAEPMLSASFLEQHVKEVVMPDHVEDNHEDDIDGQNMEKSSSDKSGKRKKQPVLTRFEKSVIDGDVEPETQGQKRRYKEPYARHGVQFKEKRESGGLRAKNLRSLMEISQEYLVGQSFTRLIQVTA